MAFPYNFGAMVNPTVAGQAAQVPPVQPGSLQQNIQAFRQPIQDFRTQMQDWRGQRPQFTAGESPQDYRTAIQNWRGTRPAFPVLPGIGAAMQPITGMSGQTAPFGMNFNPQAYLQNVLPNFPGSLLPQPQPAQPNTQMATNPQPGSV